MNRHSRSSSGLVASMWVVAALAAVAVLLLVPPSSADTYACGKAGVGAPQEGDGNCSNCQKKPPPPPAAEPPQQQAAKTKTGPKGPTTDPYGKTNWSGLEGGGGTAAGNEGFSDEPDMIDGMLGPDAGDLRFKLRPGDIICFGRGLPETPDDAILDGPDVNAPVPGRGKPPT